ncbi:MAG: DNA-processing protein DprA [Candidatus Bipolaricaulaceae bacterium]
MERRLAWIGLNQLPSLTPRRRRLLLAKLGGPEGVWGASPHQLSRVVGEQAAANLAAERRQADPEREVALARRAGARILTWEDDSFPQELRQIPSPPLVLYVVGELRPEDVPGVAVVGTRRCTSYGRLVAERLGSELAGRGITVVSGLAPGVDTAAHRGALKAGRTVAVLGSGLGRPYPAGSGPLLERIARAGAAVSEFPWEMTGTKWSFPRRNRIIAGLSAGVVVVEAPARSGALITVDRALQQGKEVFAVPGPITSTASQGTHRLIQEGAKLVTGVEDVLAELPSLRPAPPLEPAGEEGPVVDGPARTVYDLLSFEPLGLSELVDKAGLSHSCVAQALVELELAGLIREVAGRRYVRTR